MRIRFTLFLLVANLAVFGLIWNNARERNREQPPAELVFPVNADRIALVVADSSENSYTLAQKSGRWSLTTPFEWPANAWVAQKILDELRFVSREGSFTLESVKQYGNTLASYGLDKPRCTLTVGAEKRDTTVKIGGMTPNGEGAYLLSPDGTRILIAPNSFLSALLRKPEDLRQPEVFSVQPFEVRAVTLTLLKSGEPETRIGLVRAKRDVPGGEPEFIWRFETPIASDAETAVVDRGLAALGDLKFRKFLAGSPELLEKAGLASPQAVTETRLSRLTLDGNNRKQTLLIGAFDTSEKTPYRYAKFEDNPAVFTIPAEALAQWTDVRRVMRDHRFLRFDPGQLTGITVSDDIGHSLVLHRLDAPVAGAAAGHAEWQMPVVPGSTAKVTTPVDADLLDQLENSLVNLTARDFARPSSNTALPAQLFEAFVTDNPTDEDLATWGLKAPVKRVDLAFRDGTKRSLLVAKPIAPGTPYHAKLVSAPTVYSIAPAVLSSLSTDSDAYRRRTLSAMPDGARLTAMKITDLATNKVLLDEKKPDDVVSWDAFLENRTKAEREEIPALADCVRQVRADSFTGAAFSENYRYDAGDGIAPEGWRYRLEWTLKLPADADGAHTETHTLLLTRRLGGSRQIAGSAKDDTVFFLTQKWIDALQPLTFGRDSTTDLPPIPNPVAPAAPDAPAPDKKPAATPAPAAAPVQK